MLRQCDNARPAMPLQRGHCASTSATQTDASGSRGFMRKSKSISGYRERQPEGGLSEFLHADHLLVQAAFLHFAMKLFLAAP
jgi:hypothetical protein